MSPKLNHWPDQSTMIRSGAQAEPETRSSDITSALRGTCDLIWSDSDLPRLPGHEPAANWKIRRRGSLPRWSPSHAKRLADNTTGRMRITRQDEQITKELDEENQQYPPLEAGGVDDMVVSMCVHRRNTPSWHDNDTIGEEFADEMTGAPLPRDGVIKARAEEMAGYDKFEACEAVPDETYLSRTGCRPISCRGSRRLSDLSSRFSVNSQIRSRILSPRKEFQGQWMVDASEITLFRVACLFLTRPAITVDTNSQSLRMCL